MRDKLEQLFYFGLGSALLAKEKMEQATESTRGFREQGDRKAREFFDEAVAKGSGEREQFKGMIKDLLKEVVGELGLATRADVAALREEVALLRREQQKYGD
jgi:polyhydroxyalkanoate synthesis regulator phasin